MTITFTKTGLSFGTDHLPGEKRPCVTISYGNVVYKLANLAETDRDIFDKMLQVIGKELTQEQFIAQTFGFTKPATEVAMTDTIETRIQALELERDERLARLDAEQARQSNRIGHYGTDYHMERHMIMQDYAARIAEVKKRGE